MSSRSRAKVNRHMRHTLPRFPIYNAMTGKKPQQPILSLYTHSCFIVKSCLPEPLRTLVRHEEEEEDLLVVDVVVEVRVVEARHLAMLASRVSDLAGNVGVRSQIQ